VVWFVRPGHSLFGIQNLSAHYDNKLHDIPFLTSVISEPVFCSKYSTPVQTNGMRSVEQRETDQPATHLPEIFFMFFIIKNTF
jgi:hypothetical protein